MISFNEISPKDVRKFYELLEHYDKCSRSIAVLGSKKSFDKFVERYMKKHRGFKYLLREGESLITLRNGIERTFVRIKKYSELDGVYFSKIIILKERYSIE